MPDDPDCSADDFLDADDELALRSMEDTPDVYITFDDREKVMLGGKEYVRSAQRFSDDEERITVHLHLCKKDRRQADLYHHYKRRQAGG